MTKELFLWCEKHRPQTVADTILPVELKATFQSFVDQKNIPNLLLVGSPGVGKTTIARAMLAELKADYIVINGSLNGNIDTLRHEILDFASTMSLYGGRKYVILDEADYINAKSTQPALRNFMEDFSSNCGFILTANYAAKIIQPIWSRCSVVDFSFSRQVLPQIAKQFLDRMATILKIEGVEFDRIVLREVLMHYYPDFRRIVNELQRYSTRGKIDTGILALMKGGELSPLINHIKQRNFTDARVWLAENVDSTQSFFRLFYNAAREVAPEVAPALVMLIARYQYQDAFVANKEINMAAFVAEVMSEGLFE
jgi:DNA polymerase III delta prime subunit